MSKITFLKVKICGNLEISYLPHSSEMLLIKMKLWLACGTVQMQSMKE